MPRENLPNVLASKNLKDTGGISMLGKQIANTTTDAPSALAAEGRGPVLTHAESKNEGGLKSRPHEKTGSNGDESRELSQANAVEERVGAQERRPAKTGTSARGETHDEPLSKPLGAYTYLAQPSPAKADLEFRREEARTILVRLLARRVASLANTPRTYRKAA